MVDTRSSEYGPQPGYQGSETSRARVTIYTHLGDPIITNGGQLISTAGRSERDTEPALMQVNTQKAQGPAAGQFSFSVKVPANIPSPLDQILDDDWVDIEFFRHGRGWHVMRGLVDSVRRVEGVRGTGATSTAYTITGRDFGCIWEKTPVWFSTYCKENVHGHFSAKVFSTRRADQQDSTVTGDSLILGSPSAAVRGYLLGFLEELGGIGRENWQPPTEVPGITNASIVESLYYNNVAFSDEPERVGIDPNFIMAGGNLWDLAKDWSDPLFTELYVDMMPNATLPAQDNEVPIEESVMTILYRDKPFPIVAEEWQGLKGADSPYFSLPVFIAPREMLDAHDVGRGGSERFNAYFVSSPLHQESLGQAAVDLLSPLWDTSDIKRHGLRRFDVQSKYGSADASLLNLAEAQRAIIRDWYCLNPYFLNGTLSLKRGMPDLKIGVRLRVPGAAPEKDTTYYVESVNHSWEPTSGLRTNVGVTRGWVGTDQSLLDALQTVVDGYVLEPKVTAGSG